ncbi:MAG: InlB B-repeat-containing protein [Treponema sp.]|nr:InlB B-repeat-containing protein [Treponema sp.]
MKNKLFSKIKTISVLLSLILSSILLYSCHLPSNVKICTITFDTDGGSEVAEQKIYAGTTISRVNNPQKEGFSLMYWTLNNEEFDFETKIYEDTILKAKWGQLYTITFDTDGGSEVAFQRIFGGTSVSAVRSPKKDGYGFDGWFCGDTKFDFDSIINEDTTLKAHWRLLMTVTLNTLGGQRLADLKVKTGDKVSLPNPKKAGCSFEGWFTDEECTNQFDTSTVINENMTLYAKWKVNSYPNPYEFNDGTFVENPEDWAARAEEIYNDYQTKMYGKWRSGEKVVWKITADEEKVNTKYLNLDVTANNKTISLPQVIIQLPDSTKVTPPDENGWPIVFGLHEGVSENIALENGYAFITYSGNIWFGGGITEIAADNNKHTGLFYNLYPYGSDPDSQTGELMAWGWGISKIVDALYTGAAEELGLNKENSIVTGVSRYGKAAAVCGSFEKRIKMVAPGCSGAGGMASYNYFSEDMTYDLSSVAASENYLWSANEKISNLQSESEQGWFNDEFRKFKTPEALPVDQYMLAAMNADQNRYFVILGAASNSDDWVNAPAMWLSFRAAESIYKFLGLEDHIYCYFHNNGHAVTEDDMKLLLDLFNDKIYGNKTTISGYNDYTNTLKTSVFEESANYDSLFDSIDEQWNHPVDNERNHERLEDIRKGNSELYK